MRWRVDSRYEAEMHSRALRNLPVGPCHCAQPNCPLDPLVFLRTPPAEPGDTWRVTWYKPDSEEGPLAGYDICCPKCQGTHGWTTAHNCSSRRSYTVTGVDGKEYPGWKCDHSGTGSCWVWSGDPERNELSASPSLHCDPARGGCGWHGYLTAGVMRDC